jgi:hypothetical protein
MTKRKSKATKTSKTKAKSKSITRASTAKTSVTITARWDAAGRRASPQRWFRAAAELGHGHAQLMLGRYLGSGAAGKPNRAEACLWLERALAQGIPDAEADLTELTSPLVQ